MSRSDQISVSGASVGSQSGAGLIEDEIADREYLAELTATWGLVADFCFSDLLLFVRRGEEFVVAAQIRSTTSRTLYEDDLVGHTVAQAVRPLLGESMASGSILEGQNAPLTGEGTVRVTYIPVHRMRADGSKVAVAVLTRELGSDMTHRPGRLERTYLEIFDALAAMIRDGLFPFLPVDPARPVGTPRVGDGVMVLGAHETITYVSPNATSALHRLGIVANPQDRRLSEIIPGAGAAEACLKTNLPAFVEIEGERDASGNRATVVLRSIPLLASVATSDLVDHSVEGVAGVSGGLSLAVPAVRAVVLIRDVSDIRRRDRLIVTKDASIREVHHRVKNNLQTISALLRLQGRRLESAEAKQAIEESVRRIRSIALVHETLSTADRDAVPFDELVRPLVRLVEEGLATPGITFTVEGALGDLPPETATPLIVVLTELLQNAVEHAFAGSVGSSSAGSGVGSGLDAGFGSGPDAGFLPGSGSGSGVGEVILGGEPRKQGRVEIRLASEPDKLTIEVRDNGNGLPEGFSLSGSKSLGLSIVRTLVTTELGGALAFRNDNGTVVTLHVPRVADPRTRHG
jgi:two-component system, sensor histidine kinase PdtaS